MLARLDQGLDPFAVDDEGDRGHRADTWARARLTATAWKRRSTRSRSGAAAATDAATAAAEASAARSVNSTGGPSSAPMTMRATPRGLSMRTAPIASGNSPALRQI